MIQNVIYSAIGLCLATVLGSIIGFFFKQFPHKWNDTVLGFCAGVMLAASIHGLILPAADMTTGSWTLLGVLAAGMVGALFLNVLDFLTPHLHNLTGLEQEHHSHNASINHVLLFVMAIAIHKLPEGMAVGVGFNAEELDNAWAVTVGIALQNVPEGMVVISPLLLAGVSRWRTFFISLGIGLLEIVGVMIGFYAGGISLALLPVMLAFAGGAMLYVICDEMIIETHSHGYQKQASYALMLGYFTLFFLERVI